MAKCTITFEDLPDNKIKVICEPNFESLMAMVISGHEWTSAQGMAVFAMNRIREQGKSNESKILIPGLY